MGWSGELFMSSGERYFGVYFPSCEATREINTKINLEWARKQFVTIEIYYSTCIAYTTSYDQIWRSKRRFSHIDIVPHLVCVRSCDEVTIDCVQQWRPCLLGNCEGRTWKEVSNSLGIVLFTAIFTASRVRNTYKVWAFWCHDMQRLITGSRKNNSLYSMKYRAKTRCQLF